MKIAFVGFYPCVSHTFTCIQLVPDKHLFPILMPEPVACV